MDLLITGGAGFTGRELTPQLTAAGHRVAVYDQDAGNLPDGITFVEGDVRDSARLDEAIARVRPQAVYHLAAVHYIPYCESHPREALETNILGTQAVLDACGDRIERFVLASSAAVYAPSQRPHSEDDPTLPSDVYSLSKLSAEVLARKYHRETGVRTNIVRLFNVYGPGDGIPHVIPEIVRQLAAGRGLQLGNVRTRRDYVHVRDVARSLAMLLDLRDPPFAVLNVGTGEARTVGEIVRLAGELLGRDLGFETEQERLREHDRPLLQANTARIRELLGWEPQVALREGLAELLEPLAAAAAREAT